MNRICEFLKNQCFTKQPDVKVIKAVKGGSSGKGTALKNSSDADLVVFLSCFKSFQHQRDTRHEILEGIRAMLDKYSQSLAYQVDNININIIKQSTTSPKSLSFELQSKKSSETVSFDVLPTYDALTPQCDRSKAHLELTQFANENEMTDGEFSACFTELQRSFVKRQFPKVKDLIRLLKYWYKEYVKPRKSELRNGARLPAKYALELLTIYAWEEGNHQERFDTAEGFRTVLELICRYQDLCIYWTNYYDVNNAVLAEFIIKKLSNRRPIILDPADPTGNVASSDGWNVMKDEARKWLSMPCVSNVEAWDVQSVKTFRVTVTALNGNSLQQNASIYNKVSEIKRGIQEEWNIPALQQCLQFKDTILDDRITLLVAKIFFDAEIQLLTLSVMEIFVGIDGRNRTIQVLPSDKVSSLKAKIESLERIRRSQYYLTFQSTPLEDERTLQSYGITQYSTILVNLRVRERMEEAYERKRAKYEDLKNSCQRRGWRAKCWPAEVGGRGFAGQSRSKGKTTVLRKNIRSATMELYYTEPRRLDDFIKRNLEPVGFNAEVKQAVHRICEFLKNRCFMSQPSIKVIRAVKGGSSGKGTAVKMSSDADLVIFLSCFKSFQDQRDTRLEILEGIQQMLEECSRSLAYEIRDITITSTKQSSIPPKSLSFNLKSKKSSESVSFDVLPTYDALKGLYNPNEAHCELIRFLSRNRSTDGEFSPCFTELQRAFVKKYTSKVKDLIRLMKYWYILYVKPRKSELRAGARLPPKYALELLTIHAWEQGNRKESFDTAEGFRTVLELICRYRELCIYWTDYYDVTNGSLAEFLNNKLRERRPIILDPANPTGNVASSDGWDVMENEARKCLRMPCVSSVRAWNVQPVKKFTITVTALDGRSLRLHLIVHARISEIKRSVEEEWTIPAPLQRLVYRGTIMNEDKTLLDSNIFFETEIQLIRLMEIIVQLPEGNRAVKVSQIDKVSNLKEQIQSQTSFQTRQYYLTFQSQALEDGRTLQSYGIEHNSIITVNLRLLGGHFCGLGWLEFGLFYCVVESPLVSLAARRSHGAGLGKSRPARNMDLYGTPPRKLDTFIYTFLQPDEQFLTQAGETVDRICSFLKQQCNTIKISKTVKGGSLGKGTALKNGSDADLVIFLNHFRCFEDQKRNRAENLTIIREKLEACRDFIGHDIIMSESKIIPSHSSPRSLSFQLRLTEHFDYVEVDVLPAFDALGQLTRSHPNPRVYEDLIKTGEPGGEFSTCFTELQRNFVKRCPTKLKSLIRLVKHWYIEYVRRPYKPTLQRGEYLPPKYALELLVIYAWESAEKGENFNTAEGFCTVLKLIVQYQYLWVFWRENYDFDSGILGKFLKNKLKEERPMILDPADPTGNVARNARWDIVAEVAEESLEQSCVQGVSSWDVQPVKHISISVTSVIDSLPVNPFCSVRRIKQMIEGLTGISMSNYDLEWNGQMLQDAWTLSDCGIFYDVNFSLKEKPSWCTLL
ncbi:uncharacterized protein LOC134338391 [Mobula hypostoma]|uniref:uncharacterized protein LOC134338391 n=1 Tax=Mobula hypostoma TaxID=723540 RepID=UPI002FC376BA